MLIHAELQVLYSICVQNEKQKLLQSIQSNDVLNITVAFWAKPKRHKWIRHERKHSNALWHMDWHQIKRPRWKNLAFTPQDIIKSALMDNLLVMSSVVKYNYKKYCKCQN